MIGSDEVQPVSLGKHDPLDVDTDEYTYAPGNGTLYRAVRVRFQNGNTLICIEPTEHGRTWFMFSDGGFLASTYVQEKLHVRGGDLWAIQRFVCWLLNRPGDESLLGERPFNAPEIKVYPQAEGPCWVCNKRPPDTNMSLPNGQIVGICDTCYDRGQDEAER